MYTILNDFKYSPILLNLYHKDEIKTISNIRYRRLRLFSCPDDDLTCCCCLEQTVALTPCKHNLCYKCYVKLETKLCPICRTSLEVPQLTLEQIANNAINSLNLPIINNNNNNPIIIRTQTGHSNSFVEGLYNNRYSQHENNTNNDDFIECSDEECECHDDSFNENNP